MIIAEANLRQVGLRQIIGAYELIFIIDVTVNAYDDLRTASIDGARVTVRSGGGRPQSLGFARAEEPFEILTRNHASQMTPALILPISPGQLGAIEDLRNGQDLDFELLASGTGQDANSRHRVQDTWKLHVPRSEWIKRLQEAKARNILLLEVPVPLEDRDDKWSHLVAHLQRAEQHYRSGEYLQCVGSCRTALQELGFSRYQTKNWAGELLSRLAQDRNAMTKDEREGAIWGILRHYTHLAHHSESEGGVADYTRSEAQLALTVTAALFARVASG